MGNGLLVVPTEFTCCDLLILNTLFQRQRAEAICWCKTKATVDICICIRKKKRDRDIDPEHEKQTTKRNTTNSVLLAIVASGLW